ncbi:hypothetical protein IQ260_19855 [Leptolyngbya cf. ectocarpi LEGE 11479]|uniref:Uncharacterized protein n=1 Tax=Leptolyngbya cf. ectocarpi LEGE 11479 TaxID=1828722 RepID=A0A929FB85_LEPEC|nr:hypothetical protein [Leptolyngbya ectocarpi]MBE9068902.1 hypothetical protein [Leptolyngbya cf. ectocarpi LEGE 11479]
MVGSYKHVFSLALVTAAMTGAITQPLSAQTSPTIVCRYDPTTGIPNPLGMRTFITLTEADGSTGVAYEQLGSFVPGPVETILTAERTLIFPNMAIDRVRQLLLTNATYYRELVGFNDPDGFALVNDTLICRAEAVAAPPAERPTAELPDLGGGANPRSELPNPGSGANSRSELPDLGGNAARSSPSPDDTPAPPTFYGTIAGLADGNYRYVSGPAEARFYSDQELLSRGGVLFVFRKTGDRVIGAYSYVDGEAICVTGRVSGNTVAGQAYPENGVARDLAEEFAAWGPATFLRVRRTRGDAGERYYSSATLELNDFSQINAGSSLPPSRCP